MLVEEAKLRHLKIIEDLHKDNSDFPLPDLNNRLYFSVKLVSDGNIPVAVGMLKLTSEAILITNKTLPKVTRAKALKALIHSMFKELKHYNLDDTHVFLLSPEADKTSQLLRKHFSFVKCSGESLYLGVQDGQEGTETS